MTISRPHRDAKAARGGCLSVVSLPVPSPSATRPSMRQTRELSRLARAILSRTHLASLRVPLRSTQAETLSCRFYLDSLVSSFNAPQTLLSGRSVQSTISVGSGSYGWSNGVACQTIRIVTHSFISLELLAMVRCVHGIPRLVTRQAAAVYPGVNTRCAAIR